MFGLVEDLEAQHCRFVVWPAVEFDADRLAARAGEDIGKVGMGLIRWKGLLIGVVDGDRRSAFGQRCKALFPWRRDRPDGLLQFCRGDAGGAAGLTPDNDMDPGYVAF